jgi:hypothetical protein
MVGGDGPRKVRSEASLGKPFALPEAKPMTSAVIGGVMITLILGFVAGWVAGWAARGEDNRQWRESFDRKLRAAEARAVEAEAQEAEAVAAADYAYAELHRVPAQAAPAIHVHVTPAVSDQAVAQVIAAAEQPALMRAPVCDG